MTASKGHCNISNALQGKRRCDYCNGLLSGISKHGMEMTHHFKVLQTPNYETKNMLQELMDVGSSKALKKAPHCIWSPIPPPELRGEQIEDLSTNGGFLSFGINSTDFIHL